MLESAERAMRIAGGLSSDALASDETKLLAVVKSIEVVGEASAKVSESTRERLPAIPWRAIRLMRNRMIHGYDTIDTAIVHRTVVEYLPSLIHKLGRALASWPAA
ncbi:MAG: DUF86 domain-containing protein [Phycisphaerae bacterium]|nr:DUF86 domain-containing protein [Phycisphaerae bacterium]